MSKHFPEEKMACKCGCGYVVHDEKQEALMDRIYETCMATYGEPAEVTSWCRCEEHNSQQPGAVPNSYHVQGIATDWFCGDVPVDDLAFIAATQGADGIGKYYGMGFCHADSRGFEANWTDEDY